MKTYAQDILGYYIENDSIHFKFDIRDYSFFTVDQKNKTKKINPIDIEKVALAGEFNNWSKNDWILKKINKYIYKLAKHINDFSNESSWEFKYIINEKYWAEPENSYLNTVPAYDKFGFYLDSYNLKFYSAFPSSEGNVHLVLDGHNEASEVIVSGSFNNWNENIFKMNKTEDGWELKLKINPGKYQYKFIVDGKWIEDPCNPAKVENEYGGYNSVFSVKKPVTFVLKGYENADDVVLSGDFNNWNEHKLKMKKTDSAWIKTINLTGGKHHYKFIVDDKWIVDPDNSVKEYDFSGNINSVKMVR